MTTKPREQHDPVTPAKPPTTARPTETKAEAAADARRQAAAARDRQAPEVESVPQFEVTKDTIDPPVQVQMDDGVMVDSTPVRPHDPARGPLTDAEVRKQEGHVEGSQAKKEREGYCVVDDGTAHYADGRAIQGALICSAHEINYHRDGTSRVSNPRG